MKSILFTILELVSSSNYHMGPLLVLGGSLPSKLVMMVLLIVSKLVLWPKVTHKFLVWTMAILFSNDKDGFYSLNYSNRCSATMNFLPTKCQKCFS